jgi:AhpC/TSA family
LTRLIILPLLPCWLVLTAVFPDSERPLATVLFKSAGQMQQLTFQSVDGGRVSLADHEGQIIVLVFNATWVPITDRSLSALQRIAARYQKDLSAKPDIGIAAFLLHNF